MDVVKLSDSFGEYSAYIDGIDTIDGQTLDLIKLAWSLQPEEYTDGDCIEIIENLIENFHHWHKIDAGEGEYVCSDCGQNYLLSKGRILQDSPDHASFVCDICKVGEGENE
jgi:hypothetical protein